MLLHGRSDFGFVGLQANALSGCLTLFDFVKLLGECPDVGP
jgi:hypothetical protein